MDDEVSRKEKEENDICILNIAEEVEGVYHADMCDKLLTQWTKEEQGGLEVLCQAIEKISNSKYIVFIRSGEKGWYTYCTLSLHDFEKQLVSFGYFTVKHILMECMQIGGFAIVVAGERGLTPRRLQGFELKQIGWLEELLE